MEQRSSTRDPVTAFVSGGAALSQSAANTMPLAPAADQTEKVGKDFADWLKPRIGELRRYAYMLCKDEAFSRELVQQTAIKMFLLWHIEKRRDRVKNVPGYVFTVVKNTFIDNYRATSRVNQREQDLVEGNVKLKGPECGLDLETIWTIRDAIRLMKDDERLMVFLVYYQGENVSEAGRRLGIDANKAYRLHESALASLRSTLGIIPA